MQTKKYLPAIPKRTFFIAFGILGKFGNTKRLQIQDVEGGVTTKPMPKGTKSEAKTGKNGCSEVVPIPGTSKMYPPYYKVVEGEDEQKLKAEKTKILNPLRLQFAPAIYTPSDDEADVTPSTNAKKECKTAVEKVLVKQIIDNNLKPVAKMTETNTNTSNLEKASDRKNSQVEVNVYKNSFKNICYLLCFP